MGKTFGKLSRARRHIEKIIGRDNVHCDAVSLALNSFDGAPARALPHAVLDIPDAACLPQVIKTLYKFDMPYVPRAAGTNHDGGAVPLKGGAVLNLSALNKIILINTAESYAIVEPGVVNQRLQDALLPLGFFYAPDPASMAFSTIGGNAALNAGGAKTLKYGSTAANILAAEVITPQGEVLKLSKTDPGPDLMALMTRSEGTLAIITKLRVKILPLPKNLKTFTAYFASLEHTMGSVRDIIAAGILPAALEAMDKTTMDVTQTPYPVGMEALLIIELDSKKQTAKKQAQIILQILKENKAIKIETAADETARRKIWAGRRAAASSLAKLAPNLLSLDSAFARSSLPEIIKKMRGIFAKYNVRAGLVFHAGDGNVHPNIVFDETNLFEAWQVKKAVKEIHALTAQAGGSISGEHGIGIEKRAAMALMFDEAALGLMRKIKTALDPKNLANPDKILPISTRSLARRTGAPQYLFNIIEQIKLNRAAGRSTIINGLGSKFKADRKIALSAAGLNQILDIDNANYTITAQAGCALKDIAAQLAEHNMYLPVPAARGSIGGAFSAKTFWNFADYITGLDFILSDGTFISLGGKHVKNSAGYDLIRLLHGGIGAYAFITALTVRTFAAPAPKTVQNKFEFFKPCASAALVKKVFDADNLFNPFLFGGAQ
ncbi:MAG: FAD-binding oxidoreductase [Elusimicrobiota bacterium]|jgi:glycolate oxidase subunit GlcD|nr:FAD-binding oxidoreductase [Elusimicrobiota bacterium]